MISAFGVDHGHISKGCSCLADVSRATKKAEGIGPAIVKARGHGHTPDEVKNAMHIGVSKLAPNKKAIVYTAGAAGGLLGLRATGAALQHSDSKKLGVKSSYGEAFFHPQRVGRKNLAGTRHMLEVHLAGQQLANATGQSVHTRYGTVIHPNRRS